MLSHLAPEAVARGGISIQFGSRWRNQLVLVNETDPTTPTPLPPPPEPLALPMTESGPGDTQADRVGDDNTTTAASAGSAVADPQSAWLYAWQVTVAWMAESARPLRKSCAAATGWHGAFSGKGREKNGGSGGDGDGESHENYLDNRIEESSVSRLLSGIEVAVRSRWLRAVNRIIQNRTVPSVNHMIGRVYTVDSVHMSLGNVTKPFELLSLSCSPTPASANVSILDGEAAEDLVRFRIDFRYYNTVQLEVHGVHYTGQGLPWLARSLMQTVAFVGARRQRRLQREHQRKEQENSSAALVPQNRDGSDEMGALGFTIGGHFEGTIALELDMIPTDQVSYPLIRRVAFHHLPRLVLERDSTRVQDELGMIKTLVSLIPQNVLVRHLENAINSNLHRFILQSSGFHIRMLPRPKTSGHKESNSDDPAEPDHADADASPSYFGPYAAASMAKRQAAAMREATDRVLDHLLRPLSSTTMSGSTTAKGTMPPPTLRNPPEPTSTTTPTTAPWLWKQLQTTVQSIQAQGMETAQFLSSAASGAAGRAGGIPAPKKIRSRVLLERAMYENDVLRDQISRLSSIIVGLQGRFDLDLPLEQVSEEPDAPELRGLGRQLLGSRQVILEDTKSKRALLAQKEDSTAVLLTSLYSAPHPYVEAALRLLGSQAPTRVWDDGGLEVLFPRPAAPLPDREDDQASDTWGSSPHAQQAMEADNQAASAMNRAASQSEPTSASSEVQRVLLGGSLLG